MHGYVLQQVWGQLLVQSPGADVVTRSETSGHWRKRDFWLSLWEKFCLCISLQLKFKKWNWKYSGILVI